MKKIFLFTPIFLIVIVILFSQILPAHEEIKPDFKLVVTGGLSGVRSGYEFFYNSQLFRLNHKHKDETKLHVTNTEALVYKLGNNDKLFVYSDSHLNNQDLENLKSKIKLDTQTTFSGETSGLVGSAAHVVELNRNGLPTFHSKENAVLRKDIAGIAKKLFWQRHRVGKKGAKKILVLSFEGEIGPQTFVNIKKMVRVPAVTGQFGNKNLGSYVFFARPLAGTQETFRIVNHLLTQNKAQNIESNFLDLGNSLLGNDDSNFTEAGIIKSYFEKLKPVVLAASNNELRARMMDKSVFSDLPYVIATNDDDNPLPPLSRQKRIAGHKVQFSALGHLSEAAEAFLAKGSHALTPEEAIAEARSAALQSRPDLVFALVQSSEPAAKAIESPLFDAVFSLVSGKIATLPSFDEMNFNINEKKGLRSVAPLIRVSPLDVSEVSFWLDPDKKEIKKIIINRTPVVGGDMMPSSDNFRSGLPRLLKNNWEASELDTVFGSAVLNHKGGDLAIFESLPSVTPIDASVSLPLAVSLMNRPGRSISFILQGSQVRRILRLVKGKKFGLDVSIVGATLRGPAIGQRAIEDDEAYELVTTEKVGAQIVDIIGRGGLFSASPNGLAYVELALKEKFGVDAVNKFKNLTNRPVSQLGDSKQIILDSPPISSVLKETLKEGLGLVEIKDMFDYKNGKLKASFVVDIDDIDLGINGNVVNDVNENFSDDIPDSRLRIPSYLHVLFNANLAFKLVLDSIDITLRNKTKFYSTNGDTKPTSDKFILGLDFRVPLERIYNAEPTDWFFSPLASIEYETKLWPIIGLSDDVNSKGKPWAERLQLMRLFLGGAAMTMTQTEFFRVGGVAQVDFNQLANTAQAFEFGVEGKAKHSVKIGITKLKLGAETRFLFPIATPDKSRLGFVGGLSAKYQVPLWKYLSASLLADFYAGSTMEKPFDFGLSGIFGFAFSYGQNVKWFL